MNILYSHIDIVIEEVSLMIVISLLIIVSLFIIVSLLIIVSPHPKFGMH